MRVLVAEDEAMIGMLIEATLQDAGYDVLGPFPSVREALRAADDQKPDAAVLDVCLRDGEVYPLARVLADKGVPFTFLTGYGQGGLAQPWEGHACLSKPFLPGAISQAVARLLAPA
jgi:DNA-binding response OmpR family regulator